MEEWKDIKNFPRYEVSNLGRVRIKNTNHILYQSTNNAGYRFVVLCNSTGRYCKLTHRLVAYAFLDNFYNYKEIDHISGNKNDNSIYNLRFCTHKENCQAYHDRKKFEKKINEVTDTKSNILISRGETRFQGIIDNIYYFSFDGLFTELRQSLTQQYPEYMFSIMKDGEEDFIQGICLQYE